MSLAKRVALSLLLVAGLPPGLSEAATLTVALDGQADFSSLEAAIDASVGGDEVLLGPGSFVLTGALDLSGKEIELKGSGVGLTRVDVGCNPVLLNDLGPSALLQDLTFFSSRPDCGLTGAPLLSGVSNSTPTIRRVALTGEGHVGAALRGPSGATSSGLIEDFYLERIGTGCPAGVDLVLSDQPSQARRVALFSPCHSSLSAEGGSVNLSNLLVIGAWELGGLSVMDSDFVGTFLTIAHTPVPGNQAAIRVSPLSIPQLQSSVFASPSLAGVWVYCEPPLQSHDPMDFSWTVNYPSPPGIPHFADTNLGTCPYVWSSPYPLGVNGNVVADPQFIGWNPDNDPGNDNLCPGIGSPLTDAGDPALMDPDGSRADIGAFGGPFAFTCAEVLDADGDGYRPVTGDCDDSDPARFPFNIEVHCDGVDQDCDGSDPQTGCPGDDDDSSGDDDDSSGDDDDSSVDDDDSSVDDDDSSSNDDDAADDDDLADDDDDAPAGCGCQGTRGGALLPLLLVGGLRRKRGRL